MSGLQHTTWSPLHVKSFFTMGPPRRVFFAGGRSPGTPGTAPPPMGRRDRIFRGKEILRKFENPLDKAVFFSIMIAVPRQYSGFV